MANNEFTFFGVVSSIVGKINSKRERRRLLRDVENNNYRRRNVIQYTPAPIEAYLSGRQFENMVISGTNNELRERAICATAYNAHRNNRPVILLYDGSMDLNYRMSEAFRDTSNFYSINSENRIYNPFAGRRNTEISNFVLSSAGRDNNVLSRSSIVFVDAVTTFLEARGIPLTLSAYIDCIKYREYEEAQELAKNGIIPENVARLITNRTIDSRDDIGDVDAYFSRLDMELSTVLAPTTENGVSIKNVIEDGGVFMIDVSSNSSDMLNIIAQEIRELLARGRAISLLIDSVSLDENEGLANVLSHLSSRCNFAYSAEDVFARAQGNETLMTTMVGRSNVFVLNHSSGLSTELFSRYFSEYDKEELNRNHHDGANHGPFGSNLPGFAHGTGVGTNVVRRRRVDGNDISDLGRNQAYVQLLHTGEVIQASFRDGNCMETYAPPRRSPQARASSGPINWLLCVFLLIWAPPIGLVYLMVKSESRRTKAICGGILGAFFAALIITSIILG